MHLVKKLQINIVEAASLSISASMLLAYFSREFSLKFGIKYSKPLETKWRHKARAIQSIHFLILCPFKLIPSCSLWIYFLKNGKRSTVSPSLTRTAPFACLPIAPDSIVTWKFGLDLYTEVIDYHCNTVLLFSWNIYMHSRNQSSYYD